MNMFGRDKKLQDVYTAIDKEDYNGAIKLCQKSALAENSIAKALMAYSYAAIRKTSEALVICRALVASKSLEEDVLNLTYQSLRICKCEHEIIPAYEHASNANPASESLMKELFFCYVRAQDFKKMQQVAQKLYKLTSSYSYVFWTVSSMLLQPDLPPSLLNLMEKMVSKIIIDTAPLNQYQPGAEEMELYITILMKQNKHAEALEKLNILLSRPLGPLLNDGDDFETNPGKVKLQILKGMNMKAEILLILKDYEKLYLHLLEILKIFPDQWDCHESILVNYVFNKEVTSKSVEMRIVTFLAVVKELQVKYSKLRGPKLCEITMFLSAIGSSEELIKIWGQATIDEALFSLISSYVESFSRKQCCFSDLKPILLDISAKLPKFADVITVRFFDWISSRLEKHRLELIALHESLVSDNKDAAESAAGGGGGGNKSSSKKKAGGGGGGGGKQTKPPKDKRTMNEVLKDLVGSFNENPRESLRLSAVESTCSIAKCLQLHSFINTVVRSKIGDTKVFPPAQSLSDSYSLYYMSKALCEGGIGGDREVQPGDELLLVHSFLLRNNFFSSAANSSSAEENSLHKTSLCVNWVKMLNTGVRDSPHAFTFRLDLIDPLRKLGLVEPSLEAYNGLGIKHVQLDSLSYLICPTLEECGFFIELQQKHHQIISFHKTAKRETLDMSCRAFKFSNYMKTAELTRFVEMCRTSLQLALSQSEMPILNIINKTSNADEIRKALREHITTEMTTKSINYPSTFADLQTLRDNCDYSLTVRLDVDVNAENSERARRRYQMERRIILNQALTNLIFNALSLQIFDLPSPSSPPAEASIDNISIVDKLNQMMSLINELIVDKSSSLSRPTVSTSSSTSSGSSSSSGGGGVDVGVINDVQIPWDQSISVGNTLFFSNIINCIKSSLDLLILLNVSSKQEENIVEVTTKLSAIVSSIQNQIAEIEFFIMNHRVVAAGSQCTVEFIHSMSTFCKFFLPFVPVICEKITNDVRHFKNDAVKGGAVLTESRQAQLALLESLPVFICTFLEKVREILHQESSRCDTPSLKEAINKSVVPMLSKFVHSVSSSSTTSPPTSDAATTSTTDPLVDKFVNQSLNSQKMSLNSLKTCVRDKVQILQFALK